MRKPGDYRNTNFKGTLKVPTNKKVAKKKKITGFHISKKFKKFLALGLVLSTLIPGLNHCYNNKQPEPSISPNIFTNTLKNEEARNSHPYLLEILNKHSDKLEYYQYLFNTHISLSSLPNLHEEEKESLDIIDKAILKNKTDILSFLKDINLAYILDTKASSGDLDTYNLSKDLNDYTLICRKPDEYSCERFMLISNLNKFPNGKEVSGYSPNILSETLDYIINVNDDIFPKEALNNLFEAYNTSFDEDFTSNQKTKALVEAFKSTSIDILGDKYNDSNLDIDAINKATADGYIKLKDRDGR